jgi:Holliday junction resolvasome RuvABC endonuclease subunit
VNPEVLGLDLSLTAAGVAHSQGTDQLRFRNKLGAAPTKGRVAESAHDYNVARTAWLRNEIAELITSDTVLIVSEAPLIQGHNGLSGRVELLMLHGAIRDLAARRNVAWASVANNSVKLFATGNGHADKDDGTKPMMRAALLSELGLHVETGDEADAAWMRQMGLHHLAGTTWPKNPPRTPRCKPTEHHRTQAMRAVAWPSLALMLAGAS